MHWAVANPVLEVSAKPLLVFLVDVGKQTNIFSMTRLPIKKEEDTHEIMNMQTIWYFPFYARVVNMALIVIQMEHIFMQCVKEMIKWIYIVG